MSDSNCILVGIDFSACSTVALQQAARLAKASDVGLCVFHALPELVVADLADALDRDETSLGQELVADVRKQMTELLAGLAGAAGATIEVVVGSPIDEILACIEKRKPELLVLGVSGESGETDGAGSFATKCVRKAPARVLLVHEYHKGPFRRIVVCVDFSETSKQALAEAVRIARLDGAELHVLHVYYGPWNILHYRSPTLESAPAFQRQYMERLRGLLDGFIEPFRTQIGDLACHCQLVEHKNYGRGIVDYLSRNGSDLVVLGTAGQSSLRYMFLGSTAERVLRDTPCSVLTVRAVEART